MPRKNKTATPAGWVVANLRRKADTEKVLLLNTPGFARPRVDDSDRLRAEDELRYVRGDYPDRAEFLAETARNIARGRALAKLGWTTLKLDTALREGVPASLIRN